MKLVEILPLGGAGEIGRNCTLITQGDDMLMIDCGISFANEEMHGVDIVIPDFSYVLKNKDKLRGVILTHAHEDHVGALSHLLKELNVPMYATPFTQMMIRHKLEDKIDTRGLKFVNARHGDLIPVGDLKIEFVPITHSIPDTNCVAVHTDHGVVLFSSDFKFDFTPVDGRLTDVKRLTELGDLGVVCLLSDSTNVDRPGFGPSESTVSAGLRHAFQDATGRILITMFSSNIFRMQQVLDVAEEMGRKVAVAGRRMENAMDLCVKHGYLKPGKGVRIRLDQALEMDADKVVIITTGSQGEPLSALVQMSKQEYSRLRIQPGDTILYSARPIPGNEAAIWRTVNRLFDLGATVVYDQTPSIHCSGHGYQDELKMMINLTRPFYLAPVHGEARHQYAYSEMAQAMGHPEHRIFRLKDGEKLILDETKAWTEEATDGGMVWLDSGGNKVDGVTVRERQSLADYGVLTCVILVGDGGIDGVELATRGFSGKDETIRVAGQAAADALATLPKSALNDRALVEEKATEAIRMILQRRENLRPTILPMIVRI